MRDALSWLRGFVPAPIIISRRERFYGCIGAALGLICTEWVSRHTWGVSQPWFIAPMGASAVLLFAVPASPLAQPWAIMGGNVLAALIGVTCAKLIGGPGVAAAAAAALAIAAMFSLRCLHPPSGAVALTAVLGGPAITELGYGFALWPVAANSALLLAMALAFNNTLRRAYPHRVAAPANRHLTRDAPPSQRVGFTQADLAEALRAHDELIDVSTEDLQEILAAAELQAHRRRFGDIRCRDIMSRDVVYALRDMPAEAAWQLLLEHRIKALPVLWEDGALAGIISLHDFFLNGEGRLPARPQPHRSGALVRDLMSTPVRTAAPAQPVVELVEPFSDGGLHHLPVVDEHNRVLGMITQSDMVAALFRQGGERPGSAKAARHLALAPRAKAA